jgi:hypothetical protein
MASIVLPFLCKIKIGLEAAVDDGRVVKLGDGLKFCGSHAS